MVTHFINIMYILDTDFFFRHTFADKSRRKRFLIKMTVEEGILKSVKYSYQSVFTE